MSITKIYSDQSRQVNWFVRKKTDATLTITVTQNSSAYDLSSTTFIAEIFEVDNATPIITLTQGSGITNGGASGILTISLTDSQLNIDANQYFWKLRTTAPTDYLWFNGIFQVNDFTWDGGTDYTVSVALTVAANNISLSIVSASSGGSGTVTSFSAGNLSPLFTSSVANSTTTPALTFAQVAKAANLVFAGPTTGANANPDFRALVAADIPNLSGTYQPLDSDLTAIAALTTTTYGRALLTLANAASADFLVKTSNLSDVSNAATALSNLGGQPLDSDLTAIAALTTTTYGRALLTLANAAAADFLVKASNLSDLANAATARTNLGATTVGGNVFTLTNPSAVTFPRFNADNTVTALTAQQTIDAISQMTTLGDTVYGGASGTQTRLAGNTASWRKKLAQTGTGSVSAAPAWVNDSLLLTLSNGNQTTTSASATAITELITPTLEANCRYFFYGAIYHTCNNTGGVKFAVDVPTGASFSIWFTGRTSGATALLQQITNIDATLTGSAYCTANSFSDAIVFGEVSVGANAGTVQFMFASGTATETSTIVQTGTGIYVQKITP